MDGKSPTKGADLLSLVLFVALKLKLLITNYRLLNL
jgi:hypothetical protein